MRLLRNILKNVIRIFVIVLIVGVVASNLIDYTFSVSAANINPNVIITINNNGKSTISGNLFNGYLYPSSEKDADKGIGSISGVIRINNQFNKIEVNNLAVGISKLEKSNGTSVSEDIFNSFIKNVNLKIEKGLLLNFNKTLVDYTKLKDILFEDDNALYQGYALSSNNKFSINKGESIDLKYTLQMSLDAGNELQSLTAYMPIYINLIGAYKDEDYDDVEEVVIIEDNEIPVAELNKTDHYQYIQGYPDNTVKPEGLITREEVAAVFYRLLAPTYRLSIITEKENFNDIDSYRWSVKHIVTLYNGNIIKGYPDGSYKPKNPITRAELATIASKFDNLSDVQENIFTDIEGHWAIKYINSAAAKGWVKGYPDGTFNPDQYITRAEFVTLVNNVLGRKVLKENILKEAKIFPDILKDEWYYEAMVEAINSHLYTIDEKINEIWIDIIYPELDL